MSPEPLDWPLEALHEMLAIHWPSACAEVVAEVDSTNADLMRRARAGHAVPTLLIAEAQTAGHGRRGRSWQAPAAGAALMFSLGVPLAPRDWSGLSLTVGLALAQALHPDLRIKWPNDVWWQERKLSGILIETAAAADGDARHTVIGVGINLVEPPPGDYSTPPAWIGEWQPGVTAPVVLRQILPPLVAALQTFERTGFAPFQADFAARDALAGRAVHLSDGTDGVACGVAPDGALQLRTAGGVQSIRSAEVSVRPLRRAAEGVR
ncbi:MAG: biotin--[acetyl-CoA-carboxylase] ligase [Burkholderiaceae bacterium]|jgi:BirA family biotin operon repressor/biotin-[acetyl-CoA-carboxylase] ligase|nr:MAG: biotin--[acetyl-CoA-carboxylase] ligase [Burkholderiaceae bacterium]